MKKATEIINREKYLKLLIETLIENVNKTIKGGIEKDIITHYGICIEEDCFAKNKFPFTYTRAITLARLKIEKFTSDKQLYPCLANDITCANEMESNEQKSINKRQDRTEDQPKKKLKIAPEEDAPVQSGISNSKKLSILDPKDSIQKQTHLFSLFKFVEIQTATVDKSVFVIDSDSDSDDDVVITGITHNYNDLSNNHNAKGEILMVIKTQPCMESGSDEASGSEIHR